MDQLFASEGIKIDEKELMEPPSEQYRIENGPLTLSVSPKSLRFTWKIEQSDSVVLLTRNSEPIYVGSSNTYIIENPSHASGKKLTFCLFLIPPDDKTSEEDEGNWDKRAQVVFDPSRQK